MLSGGRKAVPGNVSRALSLSASRGRGKAGDTKSVGSEVWGDWGTAAVRSPALLLPGRISSERGGKEILDGWMNG